MKKKLTTKKYEASKLDKKIDKKLGYKEGSKQDKAADKRAMSMLKKGASPKKVLTSMKKK